MKVVPKRTIYDRLTKEIDALLVQEVKPHYVLMTPSEFRELQNDPRADLKANMGFVFDDSVDVGRVFCITLMNKKTGNQVRCYAEFKLNGVPIFVVDENYHPD